MSEGPRALTVDQVAERLQIHRKTVERLLQDGKLHAIKVGRVWRVPLSSLEAYLRGEHPTKEESEGHR